MHRPAAFTRLASAPVTTTGHGTRLGEAAEDRVARQSLFRLAAAWRTCPKAEAAMTDEGAGPLFEGVNENEPGAVRAARGRSFSR